MTKRSSGHPIMPVRLPKADQKRATRLAKEYGMNRSELVRVLLANAPVLMKSTQMKRVQTVVDCVGAP